MSFPVKPPYTEQDLIDATNILRDPMTPKKRTEWALEVLHKWRSAHAYPINTFQATLRGKVQSFKNAIVAQRLKRAPTIVNKLHRKQNLNLYNMQDIGGVRAVLKKVKEVESLRDAYVNNTKLTHELVHEDDYITKPKQDGYRGIHLIYRYRLNRKGARSWNGLLIEMQLRTELQHYWATAVEVTGTVLQEPFKFGGTGEAEWREFFRLVSCAFSLIEDRPVMRGYRNLSRKELFKKVAKKEAALNALQRMQAYSEGLNFIRGQGSKKNKFHILSLNLNGKSVTVWSYPEREIAEASKTYANREQNQANGIDTVLVSTAKSKDLERAYPNYFLDVTGFSRKVKEIIKKSQEQE